jgi:epoxyqueuosine reductase
MITEEILQNLVQKLPEWAQELGFQQVGICDVDLNLEQPRLEAWLENNYHGSMQWMEENKDLRIDPTKLHPGSLRAITVRMNYFTEDTNNIQILKQPEKAYISRYALGRDYHKLMRKRLAQLAERIRVAVAPLYDANQRPFVDSAPVLERPLAAKAGLGWIGKHTLLLNEQAGSWFFLGEILTNVPLPITSHNTQNRCGECSACLKVCPTDAFPAPYQLDARRCISYLTIENKGSIPIEFREVMGNRVFGCDDCQAICPWNRWAQPTAEDDFKPRHNLADSNLVDLFLWDENTYLKNTEGSAIRRIGYERWSRNLAVGLGNAPSDPHTINALLQRRENASPLLLEHIDWALEQQHNPRHRKRKLPRDRY